jgi:hypothetical protein
MVCRNSRVWFAGQRKLISKKYQSIIKETIQVSPSQYYGGGVGQVSNLVSFIIPSSEGRVIWKTMRLCVCICSCTCKVMYTCVFLCLEWVFESSSFCRNWSQSAFFVLKMQLIRFLRYRNSTNQFFWYLSRYVFSVLLCGWSETNSR